MKRVIFLFVLIATVLTGCIGDQATENFISPKFSAVVDGNDVLIDHNGELIVATGEALKYKQLLQQSGNYFAVVRYQDSTGAISYKIDPVP